MLMDNENESNVKLALDSEFEGDYSLIIRRCV